MKSKLILFLVASILLLVVAFLFYVYSQPSKEKMSDEFKQKAVTKLLGRKAQLSDDNIPTGDTEFKGKYITFKYPAKALIYKFRENSSSSISASLEDFSFDLKDPNVIFNLKVTRNSANLTNISDIPAVRLRELRDYEYEKSQIDTKKINGVAFFKKINGIEKSAFLLHNNMVYTISVTGVEESSTLALFDKVISSISF